MMNGKKIVAVVLLGAVSLVPGCVERKITFGSSPSGAVVTLNDEEVGRTPCTVPFLWYGDYDIKLRMTKNVGTASQPDIRYYYLHTHERAHAPAFQWVGVDLFAELLPVKFVDQKYWAFEVPEVKDPPREVLIERAREAKTLLDQPEELQSKKKGKGTTGPGAQAGTQPAGK